MATEAVTIHFRHPRDSKTFTAEINLQCTGQQAINGLITGDSDGPFLEPPPPGRPYELVLVRTMKAITPNMTFAQAAAQEGDEAEIRQAGQGASR